jgi:quercetin dioxygenase-like cupin family protein
VAVPTEIIIRPRNGVFFEPGEYHSHRATPDGFMTHVAMLEVDDEGNSAPRTST